MSWQRIGLNSSYIMLATASLALLQWVMMAIIARVEGPAMLGQYALGQAFATPASYLAWLSIRQQYLVSGDRGASAADFTFLRIVVPALVFGLLLTALADLYGLKPVLLVCAGVFALKYVEGFFDLAYGRMQQAGDVAGLARTTFTRCLASVVIFAASYMITHNLPISLFVLTFSWLVIYRMQRPRLGAFAIVSEIFDISRSALTRRFLLAGSLIPFALSYVVMSVTTNAPRFLIEWEFGPVELGLFAAVFHFVTIGAVATGSIGHAILPGLAAAVRANKPRDFWRQLIWSMVIVQTACTLGAVAAAIIGSDLLRLIYGDAFAHQEGLLVAAAIAAGPIYVAALATNGCYAAQLRRGLLTIQCIALFTVVVATLRLVSVMGVMGAIAGILIAATAQLLVSVGLLIWFWRTNQSHDSQESSEFGRLYGPGE